MILSVSKYLADLATSRRLATETNTSFKVVSLILANSETVSAVEASILAARVAHWAQIPRWSALQSYVLSLLVRMLRVLSIPLMRLRRGYL